MLVGHMADVHLAVNRFRVPDYQEDTFEAFQEALDLLLAEKPDVIVVAGDLFDKPSPPNAAMVRAIRLLRRVVERGVRLVFAVGEHDQPARKDSPSVLIVAEALGGGHAGAYAPTPRPGGYTEIMESMRVEVPGRGHVVVLPFVRDAPDARRDKVAGLLEASGRVASRLVGPRVLAAHIGLDGYTFPDDAVASPEALPGSFNYVALGHVHSSIIEEASEGRPAFAYPGTLVPVTVGEVPQDPRDWRPGPLLVDVSAGEPVVHRLEIEPPRSHVKVEVDLGSLEAILASVRAALEGVPRRRRPTLVHMVIRQPASGAGVAARQALAAVEKELGVVARVVKVVKPRARWAGGAAEAVAPSGAREAEVVESVVGDSRLAELIVELKNALLQGDEDTVSRLLDEILSPRFEAAWARLLGGGSRQAAPLPAARRRAGSRGLEGWLG